MERNRSRSRCRSRRRSRSRSKIGAVIGVGEVEGVKLEAESTAMQPMQYIRSRSRISSSRRRSGSPSIDRV